MKVALIVPAAGSGQRLARKCPKALVQIGGRSLLRWTLERLAQATTFSETVVLAPPDRTAEIEAVVAGAGQSLGLLRVIAGGGTRQQSVACGLAALGEDVDLVCIHDAARPFIDAATVREAIGAAATSGAATVASRPSDSVREDRDGGGSAPLDRSRLWLVETPQVFRFDLLRRAHEGAARCGGDYTDDASLVEAIGGEVRVVESRGRNLKITVEQDLAIAAALLAASEG